MRRGLISWSRDEVPQATLEARVERLQHAMKAAGLDAVVAYTSFAQPAPVQWLTHFVPYWSEAVAVVLPQGAPTLLAALTERVHPWIREVSHLAEVISAPKLGAKAAAFLSERVVGDVGKSDGNSVRIGVIGFDTLPWSVGGPLVDALGADSLVDASALYAQLRQTADRAELDLAKRATAIGEAALRAIPAGASRASEVLAAIEVSARRAGAEEVLLRIAADFTRDATLRRMEGDAPLGERYAVELSVAYKGSWVRVNRCVAANGEPASWQSAEQWLRQAAASLTAAQTQPLNASAPGGGTLNAWTLEACTGVYPLSIVAAHDCAPVAALSAGGLAVLSVELALADGPWRGSVPLALAAAGGHSTPLAS
ncbi:aminopeptidase P family N-terminal domain-containing protein [Paraburkholderia sp. ZP32-5]|uniref:aminopeptidase P family N-terminal domain-containing protein n=1 Tax=Paraburkholderia sp. ZP32-5 TaxID=2883245 RepID=UPI001F2A819C|nr:aminopeptidase P family N-terminal domain-containing protein [Paraburkholderia sp. ZP32-5]